MSRRAHRRRLLLGAAASPALALPARAERKETDAATFAPAVLPGTEQFDMVAPSGTYRILMLRPHRSPKFSAGHPVVYLLDGNAFFGAYYDAVRVQRELAGDAVIVAVGYPTEEPFDLVRRAYDFTPPLPSGQKLQPGALPLGGEAGLAEFLAQRLLPEIAGRLPVDASRQTLLGHSFGGMFALSLFYTRPALFAQIVAISPSVWWQEHYLLARERHFIANCREGRFNPVGRRLLLMAGGAESPQTVQLTRALAQRLEAALSGQGLDVGHMVLPDETHLSAPVAAATAVLRNVLTARRV